MDIFQPNGATPTNAATLLTLPRDEMGRQNSTSTSASSSSFVLLQVPLNFTVDDFINNTTTSKDSQCTDHEYASSSSLNAYFVASNSSNTTDNQRQQSHDGICCVVESKGCTFTVHRIETSNTLILVPPSSSSSTLPLASMETTDNNAHPMNTSDTDDHNNNANKKRKGDGTTNELPSDQSPPQSQRQLTRVLAAHVVQPPNSSTGHATARGGGSAGGSAGGSSGSYFLELRKKLLRLSDLRRALVVLDPYNDNNHDRVRIGRTVFDLATSLQVSQNEIRQGLHYIGAYSLPSGSSSTTERYCLLADHILNDCNDAIVTGLYTVSDCTDDYGGQNGIVNLDQITFVKNIAHHIQNTDDTKIPNVESILLHCLQLVQVDPLLSNGKFIFDVSKVAACIVRRLFMKKTAAYHEKELFTTWQSELPGVGSIYQVSRSMLRGVAIYSGDRSMDDENGKDDDHTNTTASSEFHWHYLPVESMPMDAQKCFDSLFDIKDRYTMYELEPYLQHLLDTLPNISNASGTSSSSSMTELLLRYTKLTTNAGRDGKTQTFYERK